MTISVSAIARVTVVSKPPQSLFAPEDYQPGAQNLHAEVPEVPGMTYAWTVEGGSITSGADAATVVFAAGMVRVVDDELALATVAPVQLENTSPAGAAPAVMVTTVPAA